MFLKSEEYQKTAIDNMYNILSTLLEEGSSFIIAVKDPEERELVKYTFTKEAAKDFNLYELNVCDFHVKESSGTELKTIDLADIFGVELNEGDQTFLLAVNHSALNEHRKRDKDVKGMVNSFTSFMDNPENSNFFK